MAASQSREPGFESSLACPCSRSTFQYMESDRNFHPLNRLWHYPLLFWPHHENGMRHVRQVHRLLQHLGEGDLRTSKVQDAEEFVCKLYLVENFTKIDEASEKLFNKWNTLDAQPPATDGHGHIVRAQYQNLIWRQRDKDKPQIPPHQHILVGK